MERNKLYCTDNHMCLSETAQPELQDCSNYNEGRRKLIFALKKAKHDTIGISGVCWGRHCGEYTAF